MAAMTRAKRRILTFLIGLIGGSSVLLGPLAPDARAVDRSIDLNKDGANVNNEQAVDSKVMYQQSVDAKVIYQQAVDSNNRMKASGLTLRQQVFDQQQEILLKMEELKQMMNDLELKLQQVQQTNRK